MVDLYYKKNQSLEGSRGRYSHQAAMASTAAGTETEGQKLKDRNTETVPFPQVESEGNRKSQGTLHWSC